MYTTVLTGVLAGWVGAYVALGGYFVLAHRMRRSEPEYLAFGAMTIALGGYTAGIALAYASTDAASWGRAATVAVAGITAAACFLLHYALLCARIRSRARVMAPVYVIGVGVEAANLVAGSFDPARVGTYEVHVAGIGIVQTIAPIRPVGAVMCVACLAALLASVVLLGRAYLRDRRDLIICFLGLLVLTPTCLNDALVALGVWRGMWLGPHGYLVFAFSVLATVLIRFARASGDLEARWTELRKRSRELRRAYEDLRQAQSDIVRREQLAAVGELAAVIAHEVRNPLAIIGNAVASLRRSELGGADRTALLGILDEEASRLNRLVGDLLRYARPVTVERQPVNVREVLGRTIAQVKGIDGLHVDVREEAGLGPIWGDPNLLRQVFENLVDNAVQAMPGGGSLTVDIGPGARDGSSGVIVRVRDTGEGMDTQIRTRAKDPFFTTRPSGTGLGLAIVDRIVEAHGGELGLSSRAGEGTTAEVFLPVASEAQPTARPRARPHRPPADSLIPADPPAPDQAAR